MRHRVRQFAGRAIILPSAHQRPDIDTIGAQGLQAAEPSPLVDDRRIEQETLEQGRLSFNFDPERDVPTTLRDFGQNYINLICRPGGGSAIRTVMAIAERMPDVGRRYYENVLEKTINNFARYLETHVAANDVAIEDCQLAASQFMMMCQASLFLPFIFQAAPPPSPERIAQVVESATQMFLARYGTKRG